MPVWGSLYYNGLSSRFKEITAGLKWRLESIVNGRATPFIDDIPIGSAKKMNAAVLFFDIRGSSNRFGYVALYTLDTVIPMVMKIVHDYGGYIEKNTGDGVMAIFTAMDDKAACKAALESAMNCFCVLSTLINPHLAQQSIETVDARIGIDFGELLVARIGVRQGSAKQDRNFLTAIGHAANIACRLQEQAGTNQIWVGEAVRGRAPIDWQSSFMQVFPTDWNWVLQQQTSTPYPAWHFNQHRGQPAAGLLGLGLAQGRSTPTLISPEIPAFSKPRTLLGDLFNKP